MDEGKPTKNQEGTKNKAHQKAGAAKEDLGEDQVTKGSCPGRHGGHPQEGKATADVLDRLDGHHAKEDPREPRCRLPPHLRQAQAVNAQVTQQHHDGLGQDQEQEELRQEANGAHLTRKKRTAH